MVLLLLLMICLSPGWEGVTSAPLERVCKIKPTDVIFVLDASSSIRPSDFKTMIDFVLRFVDSTTVTSQNGTHIGIYTFGTGFKNEIQLARFQDKGALKSAIMSIQQLGGMTNTHLVLDDVLRNGLGARADARPDAQKVVVVITDGESVIPDKTKMAATALKDAGVFMFAIGVGQKTDANELMAIASSSENMFMVDNFQALKQIDKQVNNVICEQKQINLNCKTIHTDVIFVLDASSSIKPSDFTKQLQFVSKFIKDSKTIGKQGTQVGIYTFADTSFMNFPLGIYQDKASMLLAVQHIQQLNGMTQTHLALEGVAKEGFSLAFGGRKDAQKVVVVITDGQSVQREKTISAAKELRKLHIHTFAIGVGHKTDKNELEKIASSKEDVFSVLNFSELKDLETSINQIVCQKPMCSLVPADIVFVLDSSSSVTDSDFQKEISFVESFVSASKIGPNHIQVSLFIYADDSSLLIKLNDFKENSALLQKLKTVKRSSGMTFTDRALADVSGRAFSSANGGRGSGVKQVVIVITDGVSVKPADTKAAADALHALNVEIYAIGVGKTVDVKELHNIASEINNVNTVLDFHGLQKLEKKILKEVCIDHKTVPTPPSIVCSLVPADIVFVLDSSSSVTDSDFQKEISFVESFVSASKIGPNHIQVSLFIYADDSSLLIKLNDFKENSALLQKLKTVKRSSGMTFTDRALADVSGRAFSSANGGRGSGVKQVVIVITDGVSVKPADTKAAADALHAMNVEIYAIGVGKTVDVKELHNIASEINNVNTVLDFHGLQKLEKKILKEVCIDHKTVPTLPSIVCESLPSDIIFVLDSSDSVKDKDFQKYITFLDNFISHVKIGPHDTQLGLFLFATDSKLLIRLKDLNDKEQLRQYIHNMKRTVGTTFTDKALEDVRTRGFIPEAGMRAGHINHVAIVMTDGESLKPSATKDAALALRSMGIKVYAIGIGKTNIIELHSISSGQDYVYTVPDFNSLSHIENHLFRKVCSNRSSDGVNGNTGGKDGSGNTGGKDGSGNTGGKDGSGNTGGKDGSGNTGGKDGSGNTGGKDGSGNTGGKDGSGNTGGKDGSGNTGGKDGSGNTGGKDGSGNTGGKDGSGNTGGKDGSGNTGGKDGSGNTGGKDGSGNTGGKDGSGNTGGKDGSGNTGRKDGSGNTGGKDGSGNTGGKDGSGNTGGKDGSGNTGGKDGSGNTGGKDGSGNTGGKDGSGNTGGKGNMANNLCDKNSKMADVVFLLDNSDTTTDEQFKEQKSMVAKFIASHTIGLQDVQVAVITFADKATEMFNLGAHRTLADLQKAVDSLQRAKGSTNTGAALKLAQSQSFQAHSGARTTSHKVVVAITDGASNDLFVTHTAARSLRSEGVNIFCLGIGNPDVYELNAISGDKNNVIIRSGDEAIKLIKERIFEGNCRPVKP